MKADDKPLPTWNELFFISEQEMVQYAADHPVQTWYSMKGASLGATAAGVAPSNEGVVPRGGDAATKSGHGFSDPRQTEEDPTAAVTYRPSEIFMRKSMAFKERNAKETEESNDSGSQRPRATEIETSAGVPGFMFEGDHNAAAPDSPSNSDSQGGRSPSNEAEDTSSSSSSGQGSSSLPALVGGSLDAEQSSSRRRKSTSQVDNLQVGGSSSSTSGISRDRRDSNHVDLIREKMMFVESNEHNAGPPAEKKDGESREGALVDTMHHIEEQWAGTAMRGYDVVFCHVAWAAFRTIRRKLLPMIISLRHFKVDDRWSYIHADACYMLH